MARAIERDGSVTDVRMEFKGLSGADPFAATLTQSEVDAAAAAGDAGTWWLLIATRALGDDPRTLWLTGRETAAVFTVPAGPGRWSADRAVAKSL